MEAVAVEAADMERDKEAEVRSVRWRSEWEWGK
jgi:hypothetical protein